MTPAPMTTVRLILPAVATPPSGAEVPGGATAGGSPPRHDRPTHRAGPRPPRFEERPLFRSQLRRDPRAPAKKARDRACAPRRPRYPEYGAEPSPWSSRAPRKLLGDRRGAQRNVMRSLRLSVTFASASGKFFGLAKPGAFSIWYCV